MWFIFYHQIEHNPHYIILTIMFLFFNENFPVKMSNQNLIKTN